MDYITMDNGNVTRPHSRGPQLCLTRGCHLSHRKLYFSLYSLKSHVLFQSGKDYCLTCIFHFYMKKKEWNLATSMLQNVSFVPNVLLLRSFLDGNTCFVLKVAAGVNTTWTKLQMIGFLPFWEKHTNEDLATCITGYLSFLLHPKSWATISISL